METMELRRIRERKYIRTGGAVTVYFSRRVVVETRENESSGLINSICEVLKSPVPQS
jgi:hypothetical protein